MLNYRDLFVTLPFKEDQKKREAWLKIQGTDDKVTKVMNELYQTEAVFTRDMRLYSSVLGDLAKDKHYSKTDREMLAKQKEAVDHMLYQQEKVGFFDLLCQAHGPEDLTNLITKKSQQNTTDYFDTLSKLTIMQPQITAFTAKLGNSDTATFLNDSAIKPVQRGPRYVLLAGELEKKFQDQPLTSFFKGLVANSNEAKRAAELNESTTSAPSHESGISSFIMNKTIQFKNKFVQAMSSWKTPDKSEVKEEKSDSPKLK